MRKQRAESRQDMLVTTVALERDLHRKLSIAAVEENAAMTELVRQAVEEWLERRGRKRKEPKGQRYPRTKRRKPHEH